MKILHAEDQGMLREAMKTLLEMKGMFNEVISVADGEEAIEFINDSFDIVLLDIEMPNKNGLEVLEFIRNNDIDIKVIILTTFKRPGFFEKALMLDVDAYVLKERSIDELMTTIQTVLNDEKEYSKELLPMMFTRNPLNKQEKEILKLIGDGFSSKDISEVLFLSDGTVRNYTSIILEKLGAENRIIAWKIATELGFID